MGVTGDRKKDVALIFVVIIVIGLSITLWQRYNGSNHPDTARAIRDIQIQTTSIDPELNDIDGDGLNLKEERSFGTTPQQYDTDFDTLSDSVEIYQTKTSPLRKNTDNDRYNDNEDNNPLTKNSANINVAISSLETKLNVATITLLAGITYLTGGTLTSAIAALGNPEIYSTEIDVNVQNLGNDYSSYLSYDLNLKIGNEIISSRNVRLNKIDIGYSQSEHYSFSVRVQDVPQQLLKIIVNQAEPIAVIEHISYEKF